MTKAREDTVRLTAEEIEYFHKQLLDKRDRLMRHARQSNTSSSEAIPSVAGDELDQAVNEYDKTFEMRLRDREKRLLKKINHSLKRIEEGEYDVCESCGAPIGKRRLTARPEATLCIACKEDQERREKMFQKKSTARVNLDL